MPPEEKYTVLLSPDEESLILPYADCLLKANFDLLWSSDEAEFFDLARTEHPDLILIILAGDVQLSFDCCKRLKNSPQLQEIPVIFIGKGGSHQHAAAALDLGAVDYVRLPINETELLARVKGHIRIYHRYMQSESEVQHLRRQMQPEAPSLSTDAFEHSDLSTLSDHERAILQLYVDGYSRGQIAKKFDLSVNTIHWHLKQIYRKLDVRRKAEAVEIVRSASTNNRT